LIVPESISIDTATSSSGHVTWKVLRLDRVHPVLSGNKPFKLSVYFRAAEEAGHQGMLTFGGAWSNHIHATAFAARSNGLASVGIIRGERPPILSPTLLDAEQAGMELRFVSRSEYRAFRSMSLEMLEKKFPGYTVVPEGGAGHSGMLGAAGIMRYIPEASFDLIICACGTGTTLAGLIAAARPGQRFMGISVLKGHMGMEDDVRQMLKGHKELPEFNITDRFHGGGYAKYDDDLIDFMNRFHAGTEIPTDIIYTGKLMRAIDTLASEGYFDGGMRVLAIHSGGLQGNRSIPPGRLRF
jgi:1-aminocyclopropane-1-carboxylate deaminase